LGTNLPHPSSGQQLFMCGKANHKTMIHESQATPRSLLKKRPETPHLD